MKKLSACEWREATIPSQRYKQCDVDVDVPDRIECPLYEFDAWLEDFRDHCQEADAARTTALEADNKRLRDALQWAVSELRGIQGCGYIAGKLIFALAGES